VDFSVEYDRVKCQEHVGENGTEIRLTAWFLRAKWWKRKNGKSVLSDEHDRVCFGTGCACWQDFGFCVFCAFSLIFVLNWPLT